MSACAEKVNAILKNKFSLFFTIVTINFIYHQAIPQV
jgi:hypothetical protein